jgi:hypothetical protein
MSLLCLRGLCMKLVVKKRLREERVIPKMPHLSVKGLVVVILKVLRVQDAKGERDVSY